MRRLQGSSRRGSICPFTSLQVLLTASIDVNPAPSFPAGNGNRGDRNQGDRNVGDDNTGSGNVGNGNGGNFNSGNLNPGNNNTGIGNIGNDNVGINNTGSYNSGNRNAGNINVGEDNLGDCNVGNNNTGSFWTGNNNVGIGPAGNPKCRPGAGPLVPAGVGAPQGRDPALSTPTGSSPQLTPATNPLLASPLPAPGPAGSRAPPAPRTLSPAAAPGSAPLPMQAPSTAPSPSMAQAPGALPPIGAYLAYPFPGTYGGYSTQSYGYGSPGAYGYGYGYGGYASRSAARPSAPPTLAPAQLASNAAAFAQLASLAAMVSSQQQALAPNAGRPIAPTNAPSQPARIPLTAGSGAPPPVVDIFAGPFFNSLTSAVALPNTSGPIPAADTSGAGLPIVMNLPRGIFPAAVTSQLQQSLIA